MATTNIVSLITQLITPQMLGRLSSALGTDRAAAQKAVGAGVPGILAAFTSLLGKPGGAAKIENAIDQQEPGLLANIGNMLGTSQQANLINEGLGSLSSLLGGGTTSALTNALNKYAGLGDSGAKGLLGLLGPMVMGALGQQSSSGPGIVQVLESQKDNIARALPSGFAKYLSGTGVLDQLPASQAPASRSAYSGSSPRETNWIVPVLGALALLGLGWYLISRSTDHPTTAGTTPTGQMQTQSRTPGETDFMVAEQDIGKWMHRPVFSSDNTKVGEIVELNRGPDDRVTDVYMDAETSLGIGGQRYRITADKIREVRPDGIVLTLSEADVKTMSPTSDQPASQPGPTVTP